MHGSTIPHCHARRKDINSIFFMYIRIGASFPRGKSPTCPTAEYKTARKSRAVMAIGRTRPDLFQSSNQRLEIVLDQRADVRTLEGEGDIGQDEAVLGTGIVSGTLVVVGGEILLR